MSIRVSATPLISGSLVVGGAGLGVLAEDVPATGTNGAGYLYNDLSLPSDSGKEVRGEIVTQPVSGSLFAYEDSSFTFAANDGSYFFEYQLYVDGVATGSPARVDLTIGGAVINATLATSSSATYQAAIQTDTAIQATRATSSTTTYQASISVGNVISAALSASSTTAYPATVQTDTVIQAAPATSSTTTFIAGVSIGNAIAATLATSSSVTYPAGVQTAVQINATLAGSSTATYQAAVQSATAISAALAISSSSTYRALISNGHTVAAHVMCTTTENRIMTTTGYEHNMTEFIHDGSTIPNAPNKDPDSIIDYGADHSAWLGTDTITASQWLINDTLITTLGQEVEGLVAGAATFDSTSTRIWLSGGVEFSAYALTNRITTTEGRTEDHTMTVHVRQR